MECKLGVAMCKDVIWYGSGFSVQYTARMEGEVRCREKWIEGKEKRRRERKKSAAKVEEDGK